MSWISTTLNSSLGKKALVSLTGIFLIIFLVIHMIGNFQLLKCDGGQAFNEYTYFMTHNPVIKTVSYTLYASILLHVFYTLALTLHNKKARPISYKLVDNQSKWASRNMALLGSLILIFIVLHMTQFWGQMHWGDISVVNYEGSDVEYKDLYALVSASFANPIVVGVYLIGLIALALHLSHGFQSAFQTLGINHKKYTPLIKCLGTIYSIVIPGLFAIQPLYVYYVQTCGSGTCSAH